MNPQPQEKPQSRQHDWRESFANEEELKAYMCCYTKRTAVDQYEAAKKLYKSYIELREVI